jgi:hypothetical protein
MVEPFLAHTGRLNIAVRIEDRNVSPSFKTRLMLSAVDSVATYKCLLC